MTAKRTPLHKSVTKSNIPNSVKRKDLPKTLSYSSSEIRTPVRNKKAVCDRKRKARHQCKWEAAGKVYKTPNTDNLLLTGPVMPRRSFPPLWLYLSLLHTGLDTSNVSNGEGKYSTHLESVFPLSHSGNTFWDTCSEQQGNGAEGVSGDPGQWWGHFPSHWQCALGDLSPSRRPLMGSALPLVFLQPEILKEHQKY